jgi:hypothetical protein
MLAGEYPDDDCLSSRAASDSDGSSDCADFHEVAYVGAVNRL